MSIDFICSKRLRMPEVRAILRCSKSHVYRLNETGKLKKYNDGSHYAYWLRDEVEAFAIGNPLPFGKQSDSSADASAHHTPTERSSSASQAMSQQPSQSAIYD